MSSIFVNLTRRISVSSLKSEEMLALLKELSILKTLDSEYDAGSNSETEQEANRLREQRHKEIGQEMKALAEQKKANPQDTVA
jgi:hypothetical protein